MKKLPKDIANFDPHNMTFPQIKRLVNRLTRHFADELKVYRLRPVAQEFCEDMTNAVTGEKKGRRRSLDEWALIFFKRVRERRLRTQLGMVPLYNYLERCLDSRTLPRATDILRELLPRITRRGLIPRCVDPPVPF